MSQWYCEDCALRVLNEDNEESEVKEYSKDMVMKEVKEEEEEKVVAVEESKGVSQLS